MKGDAIYVNIGRGTTTDQDALVEALQAKKGEDEDESATGTLRIGGASLEYVLAGPRFPCFRWLISPTPLAQRHDSRTPPFPSPSLHPPKRCSHPAHVRPLAAVHEPLRRRPQGQH